MGGDFADGEIVDGVNATGGADAIAGNGGDLLEQAVGRSEISSSGDQRLDALGDGKGDDRAASRWPLPEPIKPYRKAWGDVDGEAAGELTAAEDRDPGGGSEGEECLEQAPEPRAA